MTISPARYALNTANAYCTGVVSLLLVFCAMFFQATSGSGLDSAIEQRESSAASSQSSSNNNTYYDSSQKLDWMQATLGSSGWQKQMRGEQQFYYAADASKPPLFGSIFAGAVIAFLLVSTLLSIYMSYMATPEGAATYMFLDPRGLIVTNGIVTFASTYTVEKHFARCMHAGDVGTASTLFALYCLSVCWLDGVVKIVQENMMASSTDESAAAATVMIFRVVRYAVLQIMAAVPVIGLLATHDSHMPSVVLVRWM